jgi:hypothetical protein
MAFDPGLAVEQLIAVYRRAYLDILETIARKTAKGNVTGFERAMLEDVNRILLELDNNAVNWANQVIPRVYNTFAELVLETWIKAGLRPPRMRAGFAQVHRMAVQVLADNFLANMRDAHNFIGRRVRDEWRKASLEVVTEKVAAGQTVREAKNRLQHLIAEMGLGAFRDARGREWRLDAYAEMVARTTTAEATNLGTVNQLRALGHDLMQMTSHDGSCEVCAPYQGRIYSISGKSKDYPPLSIVPGISDGYWTLHPRCRHRFSPYIPELDKNRRANREMSNSPFDVDPRSQRERERYEKEQEASRLRRERKKLEEKLAIMPVGSERDEVREKLRQVRSRQREVGREVRELQL